MMGVRCDQCRFYALPDMDRAWGTCHRYAPQANGVAWPYVAADDWCGEYMLAPRTTCIHGVTYDACQFCETPA